MTAPNNHRYICICICTYNNKNNIKKKQTNIILVVMASLDSILENALAGSGAKSASEALILALHADLLAEGFVCVALGDDV